MWGTGPAAAGERLAQNGLYGHAGVSGQYFRFEEHLGGSRLNRERGLLPGGSLALGWRQPRWFLDTHWDYHAGEVDHDGQTNQGVPLDTRTEERILNGSVRLGRWVALPGGVALAGYAGGGYRHWDRDIRGTAGVGGLDERYRWPYAALGLSARHRQGRGQLTLDLRLLRPVGGELDVDFGGAFDRAKLDLEGELGGRIALVWHTRLRQQLWLRLEGWYEHWELDRSDTAPLRQGGTIVGTVFEPASDTDSVGISVGVGFGE